MDCDEDASAMAWRVSLPGNVTCEVEGGGHAVSGEAARMRGRGRA